MAIGVLVILVILAGIVGPKSPTGQIFIELFAVWVVIGFVAAPTITIIALVKKRRQRAPGEAKAKPKATKPVNPILATRSAIESSKHAATDALNSAKSGITDLTEKVPGVETAKRSVEALRQATTTYHKAAQTEDRSGKVAPSKKEKYEAPAKTSTGPEYWILGSNSYANLELKGEFAYIAGIQAAIGKVPKLDEELIYENLTAELFPEPTNRHDSNATAVYINGQLVGYLSHEDAILYRPQLEIIAEAGLRPTTKATVWMVARKDWQTGKKKYYSNIRIAIALPNQIIPLNNPPELPYSLVPWGSAIQVLGEEDHLPELSEYLTGETESILLGTLRQSSSTLKSGAVQEQIEVCLDGAPVGNLSKTTSTHYLPVVKHLADQGLQTAIWMKLKGNVVAAQLAIQAQRGHEIPTEWFGSTHTTGKLYPNKSGELNPHQVEDLTQDNEEIRQYMQSREPMWDDEKD